MYMCIISFVCTVYITWYRMSLTSIECHPGFVIDSGLKTDLVPVFIERSPVQVLSPMRDAFCAIDPFGRLFSNLCFKMDKTYKTTKIIIFN